MIIKNCKTCGIEFRAREWKNRPGIYCSNKCQTKGREKRKVKTITFRCETCKKECVQPLYWKCPHKFCSIQCMSKARGEKMRGEMHPRWNGGASKRKRPEKEMVKLIKNSHKKCEKCGIEGKLHAHHKIPVSERPDLSDVRENIEILCLECHAKEHPRFEGMMLKKKSGVILNCKVCLSEFYVPRYRENISKYCSRECSLKITNIKHFREKGKDNG